MRRTLLGFAGPAAGTIPRSIASPIVIGLQHRGGGHVARCTCVDVGLQRAEAVLIASAVSATPLPLASPLVPRAPQSDALLLDRREYKCLVPPQQLPALREAVSAACRRDPHARADGLYAIRSLYLDTWDRRLFWANEREQADRFKARIRCYPESPSAPVFFEIKRRVVDSIHKTRVGIDPELWHEVLRHPRALDLVPWRHGFERRLAERFLYFVGLHHLEPATLVEYEREAWVSTLDAYARVTFDLNIRAQEHFDWSLHAHPQRWRAIDHPARTVTAGPVSVVELKFGRTAPPWMVQIVKRFELQRFAFSKYGYGVWELNLLPNSRQSQPWRGHRGGL